jgi:hypothetical protein
MADIDALAAELTSDPLDWNYSMGTDQQVADLLNARTQVDHDALGFGTTARSVVRGNLTGSAIFNAIVPSEFTALTADQQRFVRDVFSLGDAVDVGPGTNARTVLLDAFGAGTTTRDNLIEAVTVYLSRAVELSLLGRSPSIGPAHVAQARAR